MGERPGIDPTTDRKEPTPQRRGSVIRRNPVRMPLGLWKVAENLVDGGTTRFMSEGMEHIVLTEEALPQDVREAVRAESQSSEDEQRSLAGQDIDPGIASVVSTERLKQTIQEGGNITFPGFGFESGSDVFSALDKESK